DEIEVVVGGTDKEVVEDFKDVLNQYPRGSKVKRIRAEFHGEPITVGFEILEMTANTGIRSIRHSLRKAEKEYIRLTRQKDRLEKDINHILNSTSWNISEP